MAAAATVTFEAVNQQIAQKKFAPVYLLHGEEGYFIDELVKGFETALPEGDREFNQYVLYGPQVTVGQVMDICRRFPMMADRQLVILKECQSVRADQINKLYKYVDNPTPSTIFVIVFRGDKAKGKELLAAAKKTAVVFESKKVSEYNIGSYIINYLKQKGLTIQPKSVEMLKDFVGTNLSNLFNELDKLAIILGPEATVTPESIERNIGISKDFNSFELLDALAVKDAAKVMRIVNYFESNPKATPLVMITGLLYNFFSDILIAYYTKDKTDAGLMAAFNYKSSFPLKRLKASMRSYNAFQTIEIISAVREFDAQSKGNGSRQEGIDLFRDLMFHILTAPGIIR